MTGVSRSGERHIVPLALLAQVGVGLALALLGGLWFGGVAGMSVLLGAIAAFAPNAFLAARLMSSDVGSLMRSAWIGEIGKLLMTAFLFGAIFAFVRPLSALAVLCGFIATHSALLPAMYFLQRRSDKMTTTG